MNSDTFPPARTPAAYPPLELNVLDILTQMPAHGSIYLVVCLARAAGLRHSLPRRRQAGGRAGVPQDDPGGIRREAGRDGAVRGLAGLQAGVVPQQRRGQERVLGPGCVFQACGKEGGSAAA
jgi:hypothetical protein